MFAAAVPAPAGVALGVLVREAGALRFHDRAGGEVFRGDQLDVFKLPALFRLDRPEDLRVALLQRAKAGIAGAELVELFHPPLVAAAFKGGAQKGVHDLAHFAAG